jgi:hypothetical protein
VDLNNPTTLTAGSEVASEFNCRFSTYSVFITIGSVTPIVLTGNGVDNLVDPTAAHEPSSILLVISGCGLLGCWGRRKRSLRVR